MKEYRSPDPKFAESISIVETTDPAHADNINFPVKQIFENTLVNHENIDDLQDFVNDVAQRLNTLADSDDTTLDQLSEIVAYIKNNKSLIDSVTTSKVNVADIIDNLTSTATNKPLSAKQGKVLKELIATASNEATEKLDKLKAEDIGALPTSGGMVKGDFTVYADGASPDPDLKVRDGRIDMLRNDQKKDSVVTVEGNRVRLNPLEIFKLLINSIELISVDSGGCAIGRTEYPSVKISAKTININGETVKISDVIKILGDTVSIGSGRTLMINLPQVKFDDDTIINLENVIKNVHTRGLTFSTSDSPELKEVALFGLQTDYAYMGALYNGDDFEDLKNIDLNEYLPAKGFTGLVINGNMHSIDVYEKGKLKGSLLDFIDEVSESTIMAIVDGTYK